MLPLHISLLSVTRRPARRMLPVAAAGILLLSACGGGDNPTQQELEAMLVPSSAAGEGPDDTAAAEEVRFDAGTHTCEPRVSTRVEGTWETSVPRTKVSDNAARLALRDASGTTEGPVSVRVITPDGTEHVASTELGGDEWSELVFPNHFDDGPQTLPNGTYTVVWSTGEGGDGPFISCDGFRVEA
ncbi:hypothetical protein [Marinactinospora rubrisoli]|uniref:Lipoprotein n=1 Tax=Marinactinospora rubrisoli TaxID=2715399 RepID=A0ABW2KCM5_9ACTN